MDNITGNNNISIGYNTLMNITTGTNNTALGYNAFEINYKVIVDNRNKKWSKI